MNRPTIAAAWAKHACIPDVRIARIPRLKRLEVLDNVHGGLFGTTNSMHEKDEQLGRVVECPCASAMVFCELPHNAWAS